MPNEVAVVHPAVTFADMERMAHAIAKSGLFGMRTPEQALALMAIAQAEGRHPALAARDFDIIQNRPAKKSEAMLRDFLEGGGKVQWNKLDDAVADATFSHPAGGSVRISWDMARAAKAGLGGKENWRKFPRQMLRSRCVSEGVRTVWPMATSGLYEPSEVADFGPVIDHAPEKPAASLKEQMNADVPLEPEAPRPQKLTWSQLLESFELAIRDATSADEITHILQSPQMTEAKHQVGRARPEYQNRMDTLMVLADERLAAFEADAAEAELPEEATAPA